jgi:phospholipase/carboxylesterase
MLAHMAEIEHIEAATGGQPTASIIVLHGLGADGNDFVPVAQQLDLRSCGDVRFIFPHAPVRPVTINGGYRMRAWYDILGTEMTGRQDEAGLRESVEIIEALIAREKERGIAANRIVLAGFSQGCAMSLMTGVRHAEALAGIVGMSGYLPLASHTAAERSPANARTPIFLAHGTDDQMVVHERGLQSRDQLRALGYDVEWHEYPMGHSVSMEEIRDLEAFLQRVLAA